jgi:hypothetical protein
VGNVIHMDRTTAPVVEGEELRQPGRQITMGAEGTARKRAKAA